MRNNPTNAKDKEGGAPCRYCPAAHARDYSGSVIHTAACASTSGYSLKKDAACASPCRSRFILKDCSL